MCIPSFGSPLVTVDFSFNFSNCLQDNQLLFYIVVVPFCLFVFQKKFPSQNKRLNLYKINSLFLIIKLFTYQ